MKARCRLGAGLVWLVLGVGCRAPADATPGVVAKFGLFFGGQVQERSELPFELDRARQVQGFRIELEQPPAQALDVRWELSLPSSKLAVDDQGRKAPARRTRSGQLSMRPGEPRLEQTLPFASDDPLGLWNIRVLLGDRVVIDRPFLVYDARARAAQIAERTKADAGP
ncbi:MAG: hypothetical protein ABW217_04560 [Polyangiaceae bacterium]